MTTTRRSRRSDSQPSGHASRHPPSVAQAMNTAIPTVSTARNGIAGASSRPSGRFPVVRAVRSARPSSHQDQSISTIGLDIAKSVFQVHGVDAAGQVVLRRQLRRGQVWTFFQKLPPCLVSRRAPHGIIGPASCRRWGIRCCRNSTWRELASAIPGVRRFRDRPNLTRDTGLNASAFVDIDMGNSRVFLHIDVR
jgi:hypothetical protein